MFAVAVRDCANWECCGRCYCSVYGRTNTYAAQLLVDGSTCMCAVAVRDCASWTPVMLPPATIHGRQTPLCSVCRYIQATPTTIRGPAQSCDAAALSQAAGRVRRPSCQSQVSSCCVKCTQHESAGPHTHLRLGASAQHGTSPTQQQLPLRPL
jgi:hypothetical protein